jgi:hypothetical protein
MKDGMPSAAGLSTVTRSRLLTRDYEPGLAMGDGG